MPSFRTRLKELEEIGPGRSGKAKIVWPRLEERTEEKLVDFFSLVWIAWMVLCRGSGWELGGRKVFLNWIMFSVLPF